MNALIEQCRRLGVRLWMEGTDLRYDAPKGAVRRRRFREASLSLLASLSEISSVYAADGLKLTVRQLYYQCVARGWIENNEREYQKIIRLLTDAREAGLFDWDAIEDRGREVVMRQCWTSPAEILEAAASSYHQDRWELQGVRVVVVLEKAALAGVVEPACKHLDTRCLRRGVIHRPPCSMRSLRGGSARH
jgi:hypothetical protein